MSAVVALQFDPALGMGSRASYSWPVLEGNGGYLGPDLTSYGSDASLSPPSGSRSIPSSPPRYPAVLTPQQREIKRQRDQARRSFKVANRQRPDHGSLPSQAGLGLDAAPSSRSSVSSVQIHPPAVSNASSPASFMQSPPVAMADLSSASSVSSGVNLPAIYSTASTPQMTLLEPVSAAHSAPPYMSAPAPYSPPLPSHGNPGVYPHSYQSQQYMGDYTTTGFGAGAPTTIPSQYPRPLGQQSLLYQMPQLPPPPLQPLHPMMDHSTMQPSHHVPIQHLAPVHQQQQQQQQHMHAHEVSPSGVRVLQNRPKPQCWEHGCNGRQFSTFSNLLRHQREKSGQATKAVCPNCGAEFTRTTARNGHLAHDKCKPRR